MCGWGWWQEGSRYWGQGATGLGPAFDAIPPGGAREPESAMSSARRELAEVLQGGRGKKLEDVTKQRSREKGSKVRPKVRVPQDVWRVGRERKHGTKNVVGCSTVLTFLGYAGAMHRHCDLMRAVHSKRPEPCWQVPARERQESKSYAAMCTRPRHGERGYRGSRL